MNKFQNNTVLNKQRLKESYELFLHTFPWQEIDEPHLQQICRSYKKNQCSEESCKTLFRKYENYFLNWHQNNRLMNAFYNRK